jgi:hypothetical protein
VDANGTVVGPSKNGTPAYFDQNGYIWDGTSTSLAPWWYGGIVYGRPIYVSTASPDPWSGCHLGYYYVPVVPRVTFGYYDGTTWLVATVKDAGATGEQMPTVTAGQNPYLHLSPSCTDLWSGYPDGGNPGVFVSPTNASVNWGITPPSVSFIHPLHEEYR